MNWQTRHSRKINLVLAAIAVVAGASALHKVREVHRMRHGVNAAYLEHVARLKARREDVLHQSEVAHSHKVEFERQHSREGHSPPLDGGGQ